MLHTLNWLIWCVNMKWIWLVMWKIQSGHHLVYRRTDGQSETSIAPPATQPQPQAQHPQTPKPPHPQTPEPPSPHSHPHHLNFIGKGYNQVREYNNESCIHQIKLSGLSRNVQKPQKYDGRINDRKKGWTDRQAHSYSPPSPNPTPTPHPPPIHPPTHPPPHPHPLLRLSALLQLHLSDQQLYCLLRCNLY